VLDGYSQIISNGLDKRFGVPDALASLRDGTVEGLIVPKVDRSPAT
jgi:hypothetical protein